LGQSDFNLLNTSESGTTVTIFIIAHNSERNILRLKY